MKIKEKRSFIITIVVTLIALAAMVTYNFISFYTNSVSNVETIGMNSLIAKVNQLKTYLAQAETTLRVSSDNVNYMLKNGYTTSAIKGFLTDETNTFQREIDENFTGVYGYIKGEYLDGSGWVPDDDYEPLTRDWYINAYAADGNTVIIPPYIDAETKKVIISVCRLLNDKKSVISVDIVLDHVQEITEKMSLNDMGYAFIVDNKGMVIAHHDKTEVGKYYTPDHPERLDPTKGENGEIIEGALIEDNEKMFDLLVKAEQSSYFNIDIDGEQNYVFTDMATDNWRVCMVISSSTLLRSSKQLLVRNIVVVVVVYAVIIFFAYSSLRRIIRSAKEVLEKQKQVETANKDLEHSKDVINYIAYTNILTKMKNRHALTEDMGERIKNENFNVAYFDIDNFRRINETYGYDFGDKLIMKIAHKLQKELDEKAEIYNIFGNEFCLIFKNDISGAQAMEAATTAFNIIGNIYTVDKKEVHIYTSGAMYFNTPAVCDTVDKMLIKLNNMVRNIKQNGGNNCIFS